MLKLAAIATALAAATAVGALAFGALAEQQLGAEAQRLASRFGLKPDPRGSSQLVGFIDVVAPGTSERVKTSAMLVAAGGAAAAAATYALAYELLGGGK